MVDAFGVEIDIGDLVLLKNLKDTKSFLEHFAIFIGRDEFYVNTGMVVKAKKANSILKMPNNLYRNTLTNLNLDYRQYVMNLMTAQEATENFYSNVGSIGILGGLKEASCPSYAINLGEVYIRNSEKKQTKNRKPFKSILFFNPSGVRHYTEATIVADLKDKIESKRDFAVYIDELEYYKVPIMATGKLYSDITYFSQYPVFLLCYRYMNENPPKLSSLLQNSAHCYLHKDDSDDSEVDFQRYKLAITGVKHS